MSSVFIDVFAYFSFCDFVFLFVCYSISYSRGDTQPTITYSKLTIETLEQGVKYVQSSQERHQNGVFGLYY